MKRYFTFLAAIVISVAAIAQNADYLLKNDFQNEKKKISEGIDAARKTGSDAKKLASKQVTIIDSLSRLIAANEKMLSQTNDSLQKTASRFNDLQIKVDKKTSTSQNSLLLAVIIFAILFLLILAMLFYFRSKSDAKLRELSGENMKLSEAVKQEVSLLKEQINKTADSLSLEFHEHAANLASKVEFTEERQRQFALELEEVVDKIVKEQNLQKSSFESRFSEHQTAHENLETELKGLKSLHTKDIQDIKSKL